jgi:hypothetical protein
MTPSTVTALRSWLVSGPAAVVAAGTATRSATNESAAVTAKRRFIERFPFRKIPGLTAGV